MRFLIIPNFANPYDQRMVKGLAVGFAELGHDAHALDSPVTADALVKLLGQTRADVVIEVNRFRPLDPPLPRDVRHIAWFQDVFPDTSNNAQMAERAGDIVYALGDAQVLGLKTELPCLVGSLVTGVDPELLHVAHHTEGTAIDFSLCGYIPPPLAVIGSEKRDVVWYVDSLLDEIPLIGSSWTFRYLRHFLLRRASVLAHVPYAVACDMRDLVNERYRPLRGELDIQMLSEAMRKIASEYMTLDSDRRPSRRRKHWSHRGRLGKLLAPYRKSGRDRRTGTHNFINLLAREYPRLLDRVALVGAALEISDSLELYGPGWDEHDEFRKFHCGSVSGPSRLSSIFRRSRINLANNTHGLGLHSRTLECMAVGGFIFMHRSPHDQKPGGMLTAFEPGVHYGAYTPETFHDEAMRWLREQPARVKAGERAAAAIREKHLWRHRAQQILDDLKR